MKSRGFTLIELLVVIAIIGLLATFSVVQLAGSRDKARIAKGLSFSQNVLTGLGDDLVGRWDFDECSGTIISDSSGYGNDAVFYLGSIARWSTDTPNGKGCSIQNPTEHNSGIYVPHNTSLNITRSITLSFWLYDVADCPGNGSYKVAIRKIAAGTETKSRFGIGRGCGEGPTAKKIYAEVAREDQYISSYSNSVIPLETWSHVVMTNASGEPLKIYIDGKLDATGSSASTKDLVEGSGVISMDGYALRSIDDVRLYARSLSPNEVQSLYQEGLNEHLAKKEE